MAGIDQSQGCTSNIDISKLNPENIVVKNDKLWIKADVDEKIYIFDIDKNNNPEPCVVIKFDDPCVPKICSNQLFTFEAILSLLNAISHTLSSDSATPTNKNNAKDQKAKLFCKDPNIQRINKELEIKHADNISANTFRFQPAAIIPTVAVIPMKSNIKTYGPYASSNFGNSAGGTKIEVEPDLAPWVFGSIQNMNTAGNSMVQTDIGLIRAETGSITVPGLPNIIGLGAALGGTGPNLSNINVTFGSSGITTQYTFKTYTPKFGSLNRHFLDKFKDITKNRQKLLKFLRNEQIKQDKINKKIQKNQYIPVRINDNQRAPINKNSLERILVGHINEYTISEDNNQFTMVGMTSLEKSIGSMIYNYQDKAFMSLDGLFGPISIGGDGGLPRFAQASTDPYKQSLSKNPYPPFKTNYYDEINNLNIDKTHLNPLTNKVDQNNHYHKGPGCGHAIDLVGREYSLPESGLIGGLYNPDDEGKYSSDYRFLGMRGPIVLHSWGYDLDGKPIPNEADNDSDTKTGSFTTSNLTDRFLPNWLGKPATWPVAPIDLRFDRNRGVWVSPPSPSIIIATLDTRLEANNSCEASIVFDQTENSIYDRNGSPVTEGKITVYDKLGCSYQKGTKIYAYFNTCLNKYIVLEACEQDNYCPPTDPLDSFTIGKLDLQIIPGWNKGVEQILGHDAEGCLKWIDTTKCDDVTTPEPTPEPTPTPTP